jgi:type VI secretion system protein ImpA
MQLREDLLEPIAGENPSGPDLRYDPVFDQIREARREDDESIPTGGWDRPIKKADHRLVVKLAGEALAKRTKNLRLMASLLESQIKLDGIAILVPSIELIRKLQENFWETLHPEIDEDGDLQIRVNEVERVVRHIARGLEELPLTKSGLTPARYHESRIVGYEAEASTEERKASRKAAITAKKLTAEEFDKEALATPKAFFVETKNLLDEALRQTDELDQYQRTIYGEQYPQVAPLRSALQEAVGLVDLLLSERRKIDPDPETTIEKVIEWKDSDSASFLIDDTHDGVPNAIAASGSGVRYQLPTEISLAGDQDAYSLIVRSAQLLFEADIKSPVPYLVCAGLRLGETRRQDASPKAGFAVGPSSEIRQSLRALALQGTWVDLLRAALPVLAQPCARVWLDVHRYIWRAAQETGANELATAVTGTVRELLAVRPEVRHWTLEDDTGAANPETQSWIDSEVLRIGNS